MWHYGIKYQNNISYCINFVYFYSSNRSKYSKYTVSLKQLKKNYPVGSMWCNGGTESLNWVGSRSVENVEKISKSTEELGKKVVNQVDNSSAVAVLSAGPFMTVLFSKLESMVQNSLYVNILLTGIVFQLACYPQPLLRSFLLNTNMVFQPSVKSLIQASLHTWVVLKTHTTLKPPAGLQTGSSYKRWEHCEDKGN